MANVIVLSNGNGNNAEFYLRVDNRIMVGRAGTSGVMTYGRAHAIDNHRILTPMPGINTENPDC